MAQPVQLVMDTGPGWCRIPESMVPFAAQCSASAVCEIKGVPYRAMCFRPSEWSNEERGLCHMHWVAELERDAA